MQAAAGDTHLTIDLSWNYAEPGQPYGSGNIVPPRDLSRDLETYRALIEEGIDNGFFIDAVLAGRLFKRSPARPI